MASRAVQCRGKLFDTRHRRLRRRRLGRPAYDHGMVAANGLLQRITVEPGKCGGRPCIRGKRMRVSDVLDLLAAGADVEEILRDYAFLERDDILAAIAYAARQTDHIILQSA
jgi:uncharacterized protein (DUF433 family)